MEKNEPLNPEQINIVVNSFKELLPSIIEMAIGLANMGSQVAGNHVYFGITQIPKDATKPTINTTQILPPTDATNFLAPYALRNADKEPQSLQHVKEKCRALCWHFLRLGDTSGFEDRVETRGMPEGELGGVFVVGDGTIIVGLWGLTEKLSEAVLLVACIELGLLTQEKAREYSRPLPPGGVPHGHDLNYYNRFFEPILVGWEALKDKRLADAIAELEATAELFTV